jgi:hypothetical protein
MEKIKSLICLLLAIIVFYGCNSASNRKKEIARDVTLSEFYANTEKSINTEAYVMAEKIIERHAELKHDPSTIIKQIIDTIGSNTHEIYFYFSNDRLFQVQNRIINEKDKDISFMMFDFDENNNCFSVYIKESEKDNPCFYFFENDTVIMHNNKLSKFLDDPLIKKQIIKEATPVLDSTMKLFPEFKYSFNWK